MASQISSISQALAGNAAALNILKTEAIEQVFAPDRDLSAALAATKHGLGNNKNDNNKETAHTGLPTPPNSISPHLQPEAFRAKFAKEQLASSPPLSQIDSDIDLQDAADDANMHDHHAGANDDGSAPEGVGIITPTYLAKYHLADMMLEKGPIAIRHVMNYLGRQVPGFAEIPPAKARRIVVAALENRHGGGLHGQVEFEKVGWGRWDARVKGQPSRSHRAMFPLHERPLSPPGSSMPSMPTGALRIPGNGKPRSKSRRLSHGSWTADSTLSSRSERGSRVDADVIESEADAMSIDGEDDQPHQTFHHRLPFRTTQAETYSDTDEEDWSKVDPAALRTSSYRSGGGRSSYGHHNHARPGGYSVPRSFTPHTWSIPPQNQLYPHEHHQQQAHLDFTGVDMDSQEKSAIEALMQMGSM